VELFTQHEFSFLVIVVAIVLLFLGISQLVSMPVDVLPETTTFVGSRQKRWGYRRRKWNK
jgi:Cu/Ag efflux pump CusA